MALIGSPSSACCCCCCCCCRLILFRGRGGPSTSSSVGFCGLPAVRSTGVATAEWLGPPFRSGRKRPMAFLRSASSAVSSSCPFLRGEISTDPPPPPPPTHPPFALRRRWPPTLPVRKFASPSRSIDRAPLVASSSSSSSSLFSLSLFLFSSFILSVSFSRFIARRRPHSRGQR